MVNIVHGRVTTVAQGVLEWKRSRNARNINLDVQHWLDRFYLSRIGIRFLIGQREHSPSRVASQRAHVCTDIALNTLQPHPDYVGIICTRSVRPVLVFRESVRPDDCTERP